MFNFCHFHNINQRDDFVLSCTYKSTVDVPTVLKCITWHTNSWLKFSYFFALNPEDKNIKDPENWKYSSALDYKFKERNKHRYFFLDLFDTFYMLLVLDILHCGVGQKMLREEKMAVGTGETVAAFIYQWAWQKKL